jgi:hypothetical protein
MQSYEIIGATPTDGGVACFHGGLQASREYYSPKISPATAKCKWFKSWNKQRQKEASMDFFTMQGHFKFLQAQNGMYVEDNNMNQHHQHYPRLCDHKIMDLVFKLHHVVPDPN